MNRASSHWNPTASIGTLRNRALIIRQIRAFFEKADYWEVETPLLSRESIVDAWIDPMSVPVESGNFYLQTSPEAHMKRLLSAGADRIYQLTHSFRKGEQGSRHNPEFTMLEWYACKQTHHHQMEFVESMVRHLCLSLCDQIESVPQLDTLPFKRLTYQQAGEKILGCNLLKQTCEQLRDLALSHKLSPPDSLSLEDRDGWLNLILAELLEPHLGKEHPTFLYDYPASQAALAIIRNEEPPVAERFELYIQGIEFCNGYHELGDEQELRERFKHQKALRTSEERPNSPIPELFLSAMKSGYPASSGVAMGVDRLVMWLLGKECIAQVIPFPQDRA